MMAADVEDLCGRRHARSPDRRGHRCSRTRSKIGYQGGKVDIVSPRVRGAEGEEIPLPSWTAAATEDWLGKTAMNLMLIRVANRKIGRAVRLPDGPLPRVDGDGTSKSAASRRFVALSQQRLEEWLASDISPFDLLVIQIDGLHVAEDIVFIGAVGIDGKGDKPEANAGFRRFKPTDSYRLSVERWPSHHRRLDLLGWHVRLARPPPRPCDCPLALRDRPGVDSSLGPITDIC